MEEGIFISEVTKENLESIFQWCPPHEKERILYYKSPDIGGAMAYVIGKEVVAFLYYSKHTYSVYIEYIEVKKSYQRKGVGKYFMKNAIKYFTDKDYKVIYINCVTQAGLHHAEKLGFRAYTQNNSCKENKRDNYMLKSLIRSESLKPYKPECPFCFVVWTGSPTGLGEPDYFYDLTSKDNLPLVDYLHYDWWVEVRKDNEHIKKNKIKRFFKESFYDGICYITVQDIIKQIDN